MLKKKLGRPVLDERIDDPLTPIAIPLSTREKLQIFKRQASLERGKSCSYGEAIDLLFEASCKKIPQ